MHYLLASYLGIHSNQGTTRTLRALVPKAVEAPKGASSTEAVSSDRERGSAPS